MYPFVICEDKRISRQLEKTFANQLSVQLVEDRSPYRMPFIYIFNSEAPFAHDEKHFSGLHPFQKRNTVVTGRFAIDNDLSIEQPNGTVLIPLCSDRLLINWVALLAGLHNHVYPHYFFLKSTSCEQIYKNYSSLFQTLDHVVQWPHHQISVANIARKSGMIERQLRKLFPKFFGVKPGKILRAMELFRHTSLLIQEENRLHRNGIGRHGSSPLAKFEIETNCHFAERLKRLLGLEYRELLLGAQKEHWAAFWMRKWRETLAGSNVN